MRYNIKKVKHTPDFVCVAPKIPKEVYVKTVINYVNKNIEVVQGSYNPLNIERVQLMKEEDKIFKKHQIRSHSQPRS